MAARLFILLVCLATLSPWISGARAHEPTTATAQPQPAVSVGAGIGFGGSRTIASLLSTSVFLLHGFGTDPYSPRGTGLVEVAQSRSFRWVLGVEGAYQTHDSVGAEPTSFVGSSATTNAGVGASLGMRWISHPDAVVQASPIASVGVAWIHADGVRTGGYNDADGEHLPLYGDASAYLAVLRIGVVFEYRLLDQLYLRFDNQVLQGQLGSVDEEEDTPEGPRDHRTTKTYAAGVAWQPTLQLRMEL